jgi:hypothetical protein
LSLSKVKTILRLMFPFVGFKSRGHTYIYLAL